MKTKYLERNEKYYIPIRKCPRIQYFVLKLKLLNIIIIIELKVC